MATTALSSTLGLLILLFVACYAAAQEDSLQCNGTGMLMFEGDGRFSIVRDGESGSLMCDGEISLITNSLWYTRIISDGHFSCSSSSNVRLCGYGETEVIRFNGNSSILQCSGTPLFPNNALTRCVGNGNFTVSGIGDYTITADPVMCNGNAVMTSYDVTGNFICSGAGPYTIVGAGILQYVSSTSGNCTATTELPTAPNGTTLIMCYGAGNFSLVGDGNFNISQSPHISCFGDVTVSSNVSATTFGAFSCEGTDNFVFYGVGLLYEVNSTTNNCSSLIENSTIIDADDSIRTNCTGNTPTLFAGNGLFHVTVNSSSYNSGLRCDGVVNEVSEPESTNTLFTQTFGPFRCISSGPVSISGTGIVDTRNDDLACLILPNDESVQCSGTGTFEIIGSGSFDIRGIPELTCFGEGIPYSFDIGEGYFSRGSFMCNGSALFFVNGNGELESVTSEETHNCSIKNTTEVSGSGMPLKLTCVGEGDYVIVGEGDFFINQTGHGTLRCAGDINLEPEGMYFTSGKFTCEVRGILYLSGIGTADFFNETAPYQCNGVLFPGPTVEPPPFSGFDGDEVACFVDGEYIIVGSGRIQINTQSPIPVSCDGQMIFFDTDTNIDALVNDLTCFGNGFVRFNGMGEVSVNSTHYNNCTGTSAVVDNTPVSCSGSGDYQLSGVANATCSGQVASILVDGVYYSGGYYNCTGTGHFAINGTGYVNIDVVNGSYTCTTSQPVLCATLNIDKYDGISVSGDGEFTIIGDESLYCQGSVVLCPGKINYYFTDGSFYCSGDLFAHIDGVGTIFSITGKNNCSGFGFGVPPPISSGTPLTPQPVCIGYGNEFYLSGEGTFNISRILGTIDCNLDLQEVNSDVLTYSSYAQPFNCSGAGIFYLEGIGTSNIVNNDGYFNCIDQTPFEPLVCVGDGLSQIEGIGSFVATASLNTSCTPEYTIIDYANESSTFAVSSSGGMFFRCIFNGSFTLDGNGTILGSSTILGNFTCRNSSMVHFSVIPSQTATSNTMTLTSFPSVLSPSPSQTSLSSMVLTTFASVTSSAPVMVSTSTIETSSVPVVVSTSIVATSAPEVPASAVATQLMSASILITSSTPLLSIMSAQTSETPAVSSTPTSLTTSVQTTTITTTVAPMESVSCICMIYFSVYIVFYSLS